MIEDILKKADEQFMAELEAHFQRLDAAALEQADAHFKAPVKTLDANAFKEAFANMPRRKPAVKRYCETCDDTGLHDSLNFTACPYDGELWHK